MTRKKIYILCPYPFDVAPSQRLKFEQYYPSFREAGYDIKISSFISYSFWKIIYKKGHLLQKLMYTLLGYCKRLGDLARLPFYDVVYIHLWVTPFGFPLFERFARLLSKRLVYDIDDMIYLKELESKANPLISGLKGKGKPAYLFKTADIVLTSTDSIEKFARTFTNRVVNIPITIDTSVYSPKNQKDPQEKRIILGWTGSHSTSPYLHLLDEVLIELNKTHPFKLMVMGDENFSLPGIEVEAIAWKQEWEVDTIRKFDIGLYPLPDEQWVLGKGGGKALQYMSLGIPTVATAVGSNFKIISSGVNGFLVNTQKEWLSALIKLIDDPELRISIGQQAASTIEEKFSVNSNKHKYINLLTPTSS